MAKPIRVLHCPTMVGNNPQELARAERRVGLDSHAIAFYETGFRYRTDEILWKANSSGPVQEWKRWGLLWRALRDYDILHFNFGESLMPRWTPSPPPAWSWRLLARLVLQGYRRLVELIDLPILERAGKGIVVTYQGDDARQGDFCRQHFPITFAHAVEPGYYCRRSDRHKRWRIRRFDRYADRIFALNPDLLHVLPARARFLPYANVDLTPLQTPTAGREARPRPLLLHAPSHRGVKGTPVILAALDRLKREGVPFDFALVENLPNQEARRLYASADLIIDQLLAGWYGGVAIEAMAQGVPVICYLRAEDLHFLPEAMRRELPLIQATPDTLVAVLRDWLTRPAAERQRQGERSRQFVAAWHDPDGVARHMKSVYEEILIEKRGRRAA